MKTSIPTQKPRTRGVKSAIAAALIVSAFYSGARASEWLGTSSSNFEDPSNWTSDAKNGPPKIGGRNKDLWVRNGKDSPLVYTENEGDTTFSKPLIVGARKGPGGEAQVTGGRLRFEQQGFNSVIGHTTKGKVSVTGGALEFGGGAKNPDAGDAEASWSLALGDEPKSAGILEVTGGEVKIDGGVTLGKGQSSGVISVSGGKVTVGGPTAFYAGEETKIILGEGTGLYEQTKSGSVLFLEGSGYFTFTKNSKGRISIADADQAFFEKLVSEGHIRVDDAVATAKQFMFKKNDKQGVYQLAR